MTRAARRTGREVAPKAAAVPATMMDNVFTKFAGQVGSAGGGTIFGKFNGNNGIFSYGSNPAKEIEPDTEALIDMQNAAVKSGWICWNGGAVVDEIMVDINSGKNPPTQSELTDHSPYAKKEDGWKQQVSVKFTLIETGEVIELKMTSRAGIRGLGGLCKAYGAEFRDNGPTDQIIVTINSSDYMPKDKSFGRKFAPVFDIVEFIDEDGVAELIGDPVTEDADTQTPAPALEAPAKEAPAEAETEDEGVIPVDDSESDDAAEETPPTAEAAPKPEGRRTRRQKRV